MQSIQVFIIFAIWIQCKEYFVYDVYHYKIVETINI